MNWTELIITVPNEYTEVAGNIANMVVPYGIYIEDYSNLENEVMEIANIDIIDDSLKKKDRNNSKIHIYISPEENPIEAIAFLKERYISEKIPYDILAEDCKEEDWINNWKKYFKPINVGDKLLIRPIWEDEYEKNNRKVIHLEPGLAFGTGTHETTRLCLSILEKTVNSEYSVLDIGCGSGILSIASLILGAKCAIGVDIDELAVKTAIENAKINRVENKFKGVVGNLTDKINGKYDIIAMNIVADVIINLLSTVKNYMHKDSIFIMSGIIDTRLDDVKENLKDHFQILEEIQEGGWIALKAKML